MINRIDFILKQFLGNVDFVLVKKLKGGTINQTYLVRIKAEPNKMFILQQVNHFVFTDVPGLMSNLDIITEHFQKKIAEFKPKFPIKTFNYYLVQNDKLNYYIHTDNTYWRLSDYIEHEPNANKVVNVDMAGEAGKLFGFFLTKLADVNLHDIKEIIRGFHDSDKYYRLYREAVTNDIAKRLKNSWDIFEWINKNSWIIDDYKKIASNKKIPLRLVHNDSKLDNILFDSMNRAIAIIDLDTCMPGYLMSDFGDSIRSITNNGLEDDKDLERVSFNIELFKSYAKGFLDSTKPIIIDDERNNLAFFALLLTYEQAIRFYTDYLNTDSYYQVNYTDHNLQRSKAQLKLLDDMLLYYDEMESIIEKL